MNANLKEFEVIVLSTITSLKDKAHGAEIKQYLLSNGEAFVFLSTLYSTLTRLEERGFLKSRRGEFTKERGGRRKRYFMITSHGSHALIAARGQDVEAFTFSESQPSLLK